MSIVKCKECDKDVIENAAKCPHCNALGPKRGRRVKWLIIFLFIVLVGGVIGVYLYHREQNKITHEEIMEMRNNEKVSHRALAAWMLLRSKVAQPEQLVVESLQATWDGSVMCFRYKASAQDKKVQSAVFADGDMRMDAGSWEIYCKNNKLVKLPVPKI